MWTAVPGDTVAKLEPEPPPPFTGTIIKDVDADGFYAPVCVNDWGYEAYFLKASKTQFGTWTIDGQDSAMRLRAGDVVDVKWPSGEVTREKLASEPASQEVGDMGHSYTVRYDRVYIPVRMHGSETRHRIEGLRVRRVG
jgi:hypothetical protein